METERYSIELERTIFNWYYSGKDASPLPIFNAIHAGLANDMDLIVPIEDPDFGTHLDNPKVGYTFKMDNPVHIKFRHLPTEESGKYFIPLFTSMEQVEKGGITSTINQPLSSLIKGLEKWPDCNGFVINPWDRQLMLSRQTLSEVLNYRPKSRILLVRGSVVDMHVGAIVNAANESLLGGGGVDGAIHIAAGPELLKECRTLGGCRTGEAKITGSYNITHADHIIHTVGPIYSGKDSDDQALSDCYRNSLDLALANGCTSIAFPGISTGVYGFPLDRAAKVSLLTVVQWLDDHKDAVMNIYLCCFRDSELKAYRDLTR
ncbi:MAG: macro domain-containing protein [Spirochaetales bacterium]|nr:macro domain-containing protein [Spirochaetales bacterium]